MLGGDRARPCAVMGQGKAVIVAVEAKKSTVNKEANVKQLIIIKIVDIKSSWHPIVH